MRESGRIATACQSCERWFVVAAILLCVVCGAALVALIFLATPRAKAVRVSDRGGR